MLALSHLADIAVVPPLNLFVLAIVGFIFTLRGRYIGRWLLGLGLFGLFFLAMPIVPGTLFKWLEELPPLQPSASPPAAIVILSGDIHHLSGLETRAGIGPLTLERLRAGAALYRSTHLPVLTTGGVVGDEDPPVADLMAQSLRVDFDVPTHWIENTSRDTWENATNTAVILQAAGIDSIYLVTHAWHMRRALIAFSRTGLSVTPAPVATDVPPHGLNSLVPTPATWLESYYALHELIGCAWYSLRTRF